MTIGERIKEIRTEKRITQQQLANAIGVQHSAISKYEKNIVSITTEQLGKIANALEVPIEELLYNVNILSYDSELKQKTENAMKLMVERLPQKKLLSAFDKLNERGKEIAIERVEELTKIKEYTISDSSTEEKK